MQLGLFFLLIQRVFYTAALYGRKVRQARSGEFPFIVAFKFTNTSNCKPETDYICTGSMISRRDVLTISHDIQNFNLSRFEIAYGSINIRYASRIKVQWLLTYNQWASRQRIPNASTIDLGILRLIDNIPVTPVLLSFLPNTNLYGLEVRTAGWGKSNDHKIPKKMETVKFKILQPNECSNKVSSIIGRRSTSIHMKFLCTVANPSAFLREGDSGGPLLYMGELVGINKGTSPLPDGDFNPQKVNIHTGIYAHRNYIDDVINNY